MLRDKAQTLICGLSWVYQRVDKLHRAREYGEESLSLGDDLGWQRNTAYCHKCLGRLARMEAEKTTDPNGRKRLLDESIALLKSAIPLFEQLTDENMGPNCEDVGESWSLQGRTHMVAGDRKLARDAVREAYRILDKFHGSKAWAESVILDGELSLAAGAETSRCNEVMRS